MMLEIMAVLDQKDSCRDMYNAGFAGYNAPLAVFLGWQAHDVLHHGRYGPEGQFRHCAYDQTAENCGVSAVAVRPGRRLCRSCRFIAPSRRGGFFPWSRLPVGPQVFPSC